MTRKNKKTKKQKKHDEMRMNMESERDIDEVDLRLSEKTRRKRPLLEYSGVEKEDDELKVINEPAIQKLLYEKQRKRRKEEEVGEGKEEGDDDRFILLDGITKFIRQNNQAGMMNLNEKIFDDEENTTTKPKTFITPSFSSASFSTTGVNESNKLDEIIRKSRELAEDKGLQLELVLTQVISDALFDLKLNNFEEGRDLQNIFKEIKKLRTRHEFDRAYLRSCLLSHREEEEEEEEERRKGRVGREVKVRKRTETTTKEEEDEGRLLPLEILWQLQSYSSKLSSSSSQLQRIQKEKAIEDVEMEDLEVDEEPLIDLRDYILDLTPNQTSLFLSQLKSLGVKSITTTSHIFSTSSSPSVLASNRRRTQLQTQQQLHCFQNYIRFLVSGSISTSSSFSSFDSRTTDNSSSNMYHNRLSIFEGKLLQRQQESQRHKFLSILDSLLNYHPSETSEELAIQFEIIRAVRSLNSDLMKHFLSRQVFRLLAQREDIKSTSSSSSASSELPLLESQGWSKLFGEFMEVLETEKLVNAVLLASRREETEWSLLLPFTTTLIARFPAAEGQLLKSIGEQIKEAVTSLDVTAILPWFKLIKVLLPTEEKRDTFLSYSSWFQNTFVDTTGLCPTKKEQRFILRVLTHMVPDDSVSLLKIHARMGMRMNKVVKPTVNDYTDLVKTRLRDLGATVDFTPSSGSNSDPATAVNQVISHFQKHGKISENVVSAWVFNRSWYQQTFIPTLLKLKASGEIDQTVAQNFIDALNDRNLMSPTLLKTTAPADQQGLLDLDSSAFEEQDITTRVTEVLASLYSSISAGNGSLTNSLQARFERLLKEFSGTRDEIQQVVDNILNCFCQGASSDINKNGRVTSWAARFCRSLVDSSTDVMWEELLLRLQELLGETTTELEVLHVTCLALFSMLLASFSISDRKETVSSSFNAKRSSPSSTLQSTSGLKFVSTILLGTETLVFRSWERSGAIFRFCAEYLRWSLGSARNVSVSDSSSKEQFTVPVNNPSTSSTPLSAFQIELAILPTRLLHLLKWFHDRCTLLKICESFCGVFQGTRNGESFMLLQELLQRYERLFGNSLVNSVLFKNSASFSLEDWMTLEASISREEDFLPLHIRREYTRKQLIQHLDSLQDVSGQSPEVVLPSFCKSLLRSLFSSTIQLQRTVKEKKEAERRGLGFDSVFLELFQEFIADHLCTETAVTLEPPSGWLLSISEELLCKTSRKETLLEKSRMSQEKLSTIFSIANTISGRPLLETWDQTRIELFSNFCSQHFVSVHWFFPFDSTVISVVFRAIFNHLKRSEQLGLGSYIVFKQFFDSCPVMHLAFLRHWSMISALSTAIVGASLTKSIFSTMSSLHTFISSIISGDSLTNVREKDKSLLFQCIALQPTVFAFGLVDVALSNCFYGFRFQSSSTPTFTSLTNLLSLEEGLDKENSSQSDFVLSSLRSLIQSVLSYTKQHTSKPAMGPFFTFLVSLFDATIYNLTCQFHIRSASISKTSPVMSPHVEIINFLEKVVHLIISLRVETFLELFLSQTPTSSASSLSPEVSEREKFRKKALLQECLDLYPLVFFQLLLTKKELKDQVSASCTPSGIKKGGPQKWTNTLWDCYSRYRNLPSSSVLFLFDRVHFQKAVQDYLRDAIQKLKENGAVVPSKSNNTAT